MDGFNNDHSDSDSGESWTLLEEAPAYADEALDYCAGLPNQKGVADNIDKDEDTDGISVITDSEPESIPCEITHETAAPEEESRPTDPKIPKYISVNPYSNNSNDEHNESIRSDDDLLGDSGGKVKTYVHRRNKRLSTVLNIIVLGSVITAAGVAIGHMWGVRDDCSMHTTPSVNKILSNLYKLQEENAYLRNKLKELTLLNNIQTQQRKSPSDKLNIKQPRCKRNFEEPVNQKESSKTTKCVDNENNNSNKILTKHDTLPEYEKGFLRDIDKLKHVYMQNRSWLDEAIARRLKNEKQQGIKDRHGFQNELKENHPIKKQTQEKRELSLDINISPEVMEPEIKSSGVTFKNSVAGKKITYADSLRSDIDNKTKQTVKRSLEGSEIRRDYRRKKSKKPRDTPIDNSFSEEEFKKDDRYMAPKHKQERKKYDRHQLHKKQKRKNKYEQWEMKRGYGLKDYDEFSVTSSQENDFILKNHDKNVLSRDFERNTYIDQFTEGKDNIKTTQTLDSISYKNTPSKQEKRKKEEKDSTWYDKRAVLRTEARKKLEQELFGDTSNSAGWYFKRMQKREQCRVKSDNSTHRKLSKRNMNFKLKH